jgi:hypothetical protein
VRWWPAGSGMNTEAEEFPLLEAIPRKQLVETSVICKVWRLAMALCLSEVIICVLKWSVNQVINPNPICSHSYL